MKNTRVLLPALLLFFLFSFAGCYTILKHPAGSDEEHQYSQQYYREKCLDCHPDYHEYPYGYYYGYYPEYYFDNPRWGRYYVYPWWWDHYWYDPGDDYYEDDLTPGDAHDKMPRSRGRTMAPPYTYPGTSTFQHDGGGSQRSSKQGTGSDGKAGEEQSEEKQKIKIKVDNSSNTSGQSGSSDGDKAEDKKTGKKGSASKKRRR